MLFSREKKIAFNANVIFIEPFADLNHRFFINNTLIIKLEVSKREHKEIKSSHFGSTLFQVIFKLTLISNFSLKWKTITIDKQRS